MKHTNRICKIFVGTFVGLIFLLIWLCLPSTAAAQGTITLDFNSVPSAQGWMYVSDGADETTIFSVSGGILTQNTLPGPYSAEYYKQLSVIHPLLPFTISVRARVLEESGQTAGPNSFGFGVSAFTGTECFGFGLGTMRIEDILGNSFTFNNTQFHNYRLECTPGVGYRFFIDNTLLATGPPRSYPDEPNSLKLGDLTRGTGAYAELMSYAFNQAQPNCVPVPPGLISWWPGEGDATDIVGGNDGMLQNGTAFAPGLDGQAFEFDGFDDFILIANEEPFDLGSGPFSFSVWVKTLAGRGFNEHIFSKGNLWAGGDDYVLWVSGTGEGGLGHVKLQYTMFTGDDLLSTSRVDDGAWHQIVVTQSGAGPGCAKLYIDGILEDSKNGQTLVNGVEPFIIGGTYSGSVGGALMPYKGSIDELAVFNRALTAEEISAIYYARGAGMCKFLAVEIDIKPGSFPNSINPKSKGVIPVVILSTPTFNATTVDPLSVKFGLNNAVETHRRGHIEDVDHDGDLDMMLHFSTQEAGIQCGATQASLTGQTISGQAITGTDAIVTVGCGPGKDVAADELPFAFTLAQNYPNPFNPETEIRFELPEDAHVVLKIFNTLGQEVRALVDAQYEAGYHGVRWDGKDENGHTVSSGVYLYKLEAESFAQVKKMCLVR